MIKYLEHILSGHKLIKIFFCSRKKLSDAVAADSTVIQLYHGDADIVRKEKSPAVFKVYLDIGSILKVYVLHWQKLSRNISFPKGATLELCRYIRVLTHPFSSHLSQSILDDVKSSSVNISGVISYSFLLTTSTNVTEVPREEQLIQS